MTKKKNRLTLVTGRNECADLPDLADIYTLAYRSINNLPKKFQERIGNILVRVENFADEETLSHLSIKDKYDLLGLYRGTPIPYKGTESTAQLPDVIFLFRCPLIRFARETHEGIATLVNHVMIHEIGHHFGFSDYDMEWIENQPDDSDDSGNEKNGGRNRD